MGFRVWGLGFRVWVHVGIWYILRAQRGPHIPTLRPKYIPYSYMDPLGPTMTASMPMILGLQAIACGIGGGEVDLYLGFLQFLGENGGRWKT